MIINLSSPLIDYRGFLLPNHLPRYDALLSFEPNRALSRIHRGLSPSPLVGRSVTRYIYTLFITRHVTYCHGNNRSKRSDSLPNIHDDSLSRLVDLTDTPTIGYINCT